MAKRKVVRSSSSSGIDPNVSSGNTAKTPKSVQTQQSSDPEQFSIRIEQWDDRLKELLDTKQMARYLYRDRKLSREDFDAKVLELGYRAALRTLTAEACNGDVKALDLFLKRCDIHFSQARKVQAKDDSIPSPTYKPRTSE